MSISANLFGSPPPLPPLCAWDGRLPGIRSQFWNQVNSYEFWNGSNRDTDHTDDQCDYCALYNCNVIIDDVDGDDNESADTIAAAADDASDVDNDASMLLVLMLMAMLLLLIR